MDAYRHSHNLTTVRTLPPWLDGAVLGVVLVQGVSQRMIRPVVTVLKFQQLNTCIALTFTQLAK